MLTDVDAVYKNWGNSNARALRRIAPKDIAKLFICTRFNGAKSSGCHSACRAD
ncbi:hypothetical protein ACFL17_06820 [Pseudomonadota bacterium]